MNSAVAFVPDGPAVGDPAVPPPAPRGCGFIPLDEAARRCGRGRGGVGHLARRCRAEWAARGLAELRTPAGGGKREWHVREDADPAFARVRFPDRIPFDMATVTQRQRDVLASRMALLAEWETAIAARIAGAAGTTRLEATREFCELKRDLDGKRISPRALELWRAAFRADGPAGLLDGRLQRSKDAGREDDPFLNEVKRLWLRQSRPKLKTCYDHARLLADDQGWPACSFKTCQRFIAGIDPRVVIKMRMGENAFANKVLPYSERDYTKILVDGHVVEMTSNDVWCGDHHQFDVIVKGADGKLVRPWITAWQDLRSRKIVGYQVFAHDPNQNTILLALRAGVLSHGVPRWLYIDNGKDFDAYALQGMTKMQRRRLRVTYDARQVGGVCGALGIQVLHAAPYNAKAKPVERFFNTLTTRFSRMLCPTYCGGKPEERPEDLAEKLDRGVAPAFADFAAQFDAWLDADYHAREHAGDGLDNERPEDAFNRCLEVKRTASEETLELLLQRTSRPLKVGRNGVTWDGRTYNDHALGNHFGKEVYLRCSPEDITRVSVWSAADKLICVARANARMPFRASEQEYRQAANERKRVRQAAADYIQLGPKRSADTLDLMTLRRAERKASPPCDGTPAGPGLQPVRTPFEDQMPALQNALEGRPLRTAVGAESLSWADVAGVINDDQDEDAAGVPEGADPFAALGRMLDSEAAP